MYGKTTKQHLFRMQHTFLYFFAIAERQRLLSLGQTGWKIGALSITNYTVQAFIYQPCHDIAVTLYITVTGQLPKIFSCQIFSEKLTCIYSCIYV